MATSCNDDDDDGGNSTPTPQASFTGEETNPMTGEVSTWTADEVTARLSLAGDLTVKARNGSDTLSLRLPSLEVRQYVIAFDEPFADDNNYIAVTSTDTLFYSYKLNDFTFDGGGVISITSIDSVNQTFNAEMDGLQFFNVENGPDENDQFILQNAELSNIPYTEETFGVGFGDDELSLTADGTALTFPNITTLITGGIISVTGTSAAGFPSFSLTLPETLTPGTYAVASEPQISGTYINSAMATFSMTSGDLIVTSNDNNVIEGTFDFTGSGTAGGTVSITNGAFTVEY